MKSFWGKLFAVIGVIAVVVILVVAIALLTLTGKDSVPGKTILEVNFEKSFVEYIPDDPLARAMLNNSLIVRDVIEALKIGTSDDRVIGLIATTGAGRIGLAEIQEIRQAIIDFRRAGKIAVIFSETFGEWGAGNGCYYLASAFDEVYLQPSGDIGLTGIMAETPFVKGTLDKLGVVPRMGQRYEYKTAVNMFTQEKCTPAHRESYERVTESMFGQMVGDIAGARNLEQEKLRTMIDHGPFIGKEALEAGLVDGLAYRDEAYERIKELTDKEAELLYLNEYFKRSDRPYSKGKTVALIFGVGGVSRGASGYDPLFGDIIMGAETVAEAFRKAVDDDDVKAILFRVDSPGGSYVASDVVWHEVKRAREKGKPVVVSMGEVAASGGYFVSMAADKIVAQPGTITGSIGVYGGKMYTREMWKKIGITWDKVKSSANADIWSGVDDYTPDQMARGDAALDRIYEDFTAKVAEGRNLPLEKVLEIARGRVWTGEDALELGLVDKLGGYPEAIALIKELTGIEPDADIDLKEFPEKKSMLNRLLKSDPANSEETSVLVRTTELIQPLAVLARRLGLLEQPGVLTASGYY
nr:signal peptide peptidase SppA [candidate division Zixibacteria bacterium]